MKKGISSCFEIKNKCPNCKQNAVTFWKKLSIGPLRKYRCPNCDLSLKLSFIPKVLVLLLSQLLLFLGGVLALGLISGVSIPGNNGIWVIIAVFTVGMLSVIPVIAFAYNIWVPLVEKDT